MPYLFVRSILPQVVHLSSSYMPDPSGGPGAVKPGPSLRVLPGITRHDGDAYAAVLLNAGSKHYFDTGDLMVLSESDKPSALLAEMSEGQAIATIRDVLDSGEEARQMLHDFLEVETRPAVVKALKARLVEFGDEEEDPMRTERPTAVKAVLSARLKAEGKPTATASRVAAVQEKKAAKGNGRS